MTTRELAVKSPRASTRPTVNHLVTEGLGYCCEWFFFQHFKDTQVVADRLGVTDRAIRLAKQRVREGVSVCQQKENCLNCKISLAGTPRKVKASQPR